jgi:hypothetical protein
VEPLGFAEELSSRGFGSVEARYRALRQWSRRAPRWMPVAIRICQIFRHIATK